jgi:hypothetical protein
MENLSWLLYAVTRIRLEPEIHKIFIPSEHGRPAGWVKKIGTTTRKEGVSYAIASPPTCWVVPMGDRAYDHPLSGAT